MPHAGKRKSSSRVILHQPHYIVAHTLDGVVQKPLVLSLEVNICIYTFQYAELDSSSIMVSEANESISNTSHARGHSSGLVAHDSAST